MANQCSTWGCRLAVPLKGDGWTATIDDVRALVANLHRRIDVGEPPDAYVIHLLGTGTLQGRLPRCMSHLRGTQVVVLAAYKLRQAHSDALLDTHRGESGIQSTLARFAVELEPNHKMKDFVGVLPSEIRGGQFCWSEEGCEDCTMLAQEFRAWVYIGAKPHDIEDQKHTAALEETMKQIAELETLHGSSDPMKWLWGSGTPCADVFEADDAKCKYERLQLKVSALEKLRSAVEDMQLR